MTETVDLPDANAFMGAKIEAFAAQHPEFTEPAVRGCFFWVVTCYFPELLAEMQLRLTRLARKAYLRHESDADLLAWVRMEWTKLTSVGDLGENHTRMYLEEHPAVLDMTLDQVYDSPFARFCTGLLELQDPIMLLGALTRNEEGAIGEATALVSTGLIADGEFARLHLLEEPEHGAISAGIRERMLAHPGFSPRFIQGMRHHDFLYQGILG